VDSKLRNNPEIAEAYVIYDECRTLQVHEQQYSKGKDQMIRTLTFPTGYHALPQMGGILDQPYRLMEFFGEFMSGERQAFFRPRK
jgi:hypothetical protein